MNPFGVPDDVQDDLVKQGEWRRILKGVLDDGEQTDRVVQVDLRKEVFDDSVYGNKFKIKFCERLAGKSCPLVMFFPNTNFENEKVLYTDEYTKMANLDEKIKHALQETRIDAKTVEKRTFGSLKMAIASGPRYIYCFWGMRGEHNYYLYWLETLNSYNDEGYATKDEIKNVPVMIEMDGKGAFVNIVVLDYDYRDLLWLPECTKNKKYSLEPMEMSPLNLKTHALTIIPNTEFMFNCEKFNHNHPKIAIRTVSDRDANHMIRTCVPKTTTLDLPLDEDLFDSQPHSNSLPYMSDGVTISADEL